MVIISKFCKLFNGLGFNTENKYPNKSLPISETTSDD